MMATRIANLILIALVVTAAAACASAPARFYNLDSTATPDGVAATRAAVMVGPVSVPASAGAGASPPTRALFMVIPGECLKYETAWRSEVNSNCRYRFLNFQTTASC